jgi:hypothetical protein
MSQSVILVSIVEMSLIFLTTFLLTQPKLIFGKEPSLFRSFANWFGMFLLCVTFCWSVVVGIVFSLNNIVFQV